MTRDNEMNIWKITVRSNEAGIYGGRELMSMLCEDVLVDGLMAQIQIMANAVVELGLVDTSEMPGLPEWEAVDIAKYLNAHIADGRAELAYGKLTYALEPARPFSGMERPARAAESGQGAGVLV